MRFIFWSTKAKGRTGRRNGSHANLNRYEKGNGKDHGNRSSHVNGHRKALLLKGLYILMITILTGNFAASLYIWRDEISYGVSWGLKQAYLYTFSTENERIIQFVKDNYLYFSQVENFEEKSDKFRALKSLTSEDIRDYILSVKIPEDPYTFVRIQSQYQGYLENERTPQVALEEIEKGIYHITIKSFTQNSHKDFRRLIKSIPAPNESTLIIDLRNNGGGSTTAVNKMADILLPYCVTNYEIDRRGMIYTYFSDRQATRFKEIYIFVNNNSASASEVLTLALKSYGNNVRVIGTNTKGKGVGQTTLESKRRQYIIYLVQHYWNSRERNIMKEGIRPDVQVNSDNDRDYYQSILNR